MIALCITATMQAIFVSLVGAGIWTFKDHKEFLNTVGAEVFVQIAGMSLIVVKCLLPSEKSCKKSLTKAVNKAAVKNAKKTGL